MSPQLKSALELEAHRRNVSVAGLLEMAVREWLAASKPPGPEEEIQRSLHAAAERCIGSITGKNPHRSESVRTLVRKRLRSRRDS